MIDTSRKISNATLFSAEGKLVKAILVQTVLMFLLYSPANIYWKSIIRTVLRLHRKCLLQNKKEQNCKVILPARYYARSGGLQQ